MKTTPAVLLLAVVLEATLHAQATPSGRTALEFQAPTTILLADGRVLAVGGPTPIGFREAIFDPATDTWEPLAPMTVARTSPVAARLPDGRVVIGGGGRYLGIEIFDPARRTFTAAGGSFAVGSLVLLPSGKLLLVPAGVLTCCEAELFDPATGLVTPMRGLVASGSAHALSDGRVVVVDPYDLYVYTVEQDMIQLVAKQPLGLLHERAVAVLSNGNVLIAGGGQDRVGSPFGAALVYDPYRDTVKQIPYLPEHQTIRGMVNLADGSVVTTGGDSADWYSPEQPTHLLLYTPAANRFEIYLPPDGRSIVQLLDGRLLFVGGSQSRLYTPPPRVVSSARLTSGVAAGSLATLFGSQLTGISLEVADASGLVQPVRQISSSSTRIDFLVPPDLTLGRVQLRQTGSGRVFAETDVNYLAPALFTREHNLPVGYFTRLESNGSSTSLGIRGGLAMDERPVYLTLYGTGIRNRSAVGNVNCTIGGTVVGVEYAGSEGNGILGLDQINVRLPQSLRGSGTVGLKLRVDGLESNEVLIDLR